MINAIPFLGWFIDFCLKASLAIPFWYIWDICNVGERFVYQLPIVYHHPGFWNIVGIFIVIPIMKGIFLPSFSITNNTTSKSTKKS